MSLGCVGDVWDVLGMIGFIHIGVRVVDYQVCLVVIIVVVL